MRTLRFIVCAALPWTALAGSQLGSLLLFENVEFRNGTYHLHLNRVVGLQSSGGAASTLSLQSSEPFDCTAHAEAAAGCKVPVSTLGKQAAHPALSQVYGLVSFVERQTQNAMRYSHHVFEYGYNEASISLQAHCAYPSPKNCVDGTSAQVCDGYPALFFDHKTDTLYGTRSELDGPGGEADMFNVTSRLFKVAMPAGSTADRGACSLSPVGVLSPPLLTPPHHAAYDSSTSTLYYGLTQTPGRMVTSIHALHVPSWTYRPNFLLQNFKTSQIDVSNGTLVMGPFNCEDKAQEAKKCLQKVGLMADGSFSHVDMRFVIFPNYTKGPGSADNVIYGVGPSAHNVVYGRLFNQFGGFWPTVDAFSFDCDDCTGTALMPRAQLSQKCADPAAFRCLTESWLLVD